MKKIDENRKEIKENLKKSLKTFRKSIKMYEKCIARGPSKVGLGSQSSKKSIFNKEFKKEIEWILVVEIFLKILGRKGFERKIKEINENLKRMNKNLKEINENLKEINKI